MKHLVLSTFIFFVSFQVSAKDLNISHGPVSGLIVGGVEATPREYPFMVSIHSSSGRHFCGGSLIKSNWILTAGHCISSARNGKVYIGLHSQDRLTEAESFNIIQTVRHTQYNSSTIDYDFGLIKIDGNSSYAPVTLNDSEIPIDDTNPVMSTTAGWGTTSESGGLSRVLMKVDVPLVSKNKCNTAYSGKITDRMVCAGLDEGMKDSCQGDSGGPLIARETSTGNMVLIGIVSWGTGCARPMKYGVYAKVNAGLSWIMENAN